MELLKVENITFSYNNCPPILKDVSFKINSGEFVVVCGETGCGKTTLLRLLKRELKPNGHFDGRIYYKGITQNELKDEVSICEIGFVMQNPDSQIITDKVWHELAFGLESLGMDSSSIKHRIAEISCYFGIEDLIDKNIYELSGGQKQLLNLASVIAAQPKLLILDEPTAQLDPITRNTFLNTLKKINRDLSVAVIIVEHSLDGLLEICDRMIVMQDGGILYNDTPQTVCSIIDRRLAIFDAMPSSVKVLSRFCQKNDLCPLTSKDAIKFIENHITVTPIQLVSSPKTQNIIFEFKDIWFGYGKNSKEILKGLSLSLYENEILFILGGNGAGKTTFLNIAAGIYTGYAGKIKLFSKKLKAYKNQTLYKNNLALLPQDISTIFVKDTVQEDLDTVGAKACAYGFDISHLTDKHPYDLSGGERQLCALIKVLASNPKILLLDEPTKGADAGLKHRIADILVALKAQGLSMIIVSHDTELAAMCADRCALLFNGEIVAENEPHTFFSQNSFYTTPTNKIMRSFDSRIITTEEAVISCHRKNYD